jgi:hypothetical protein
VAALSGQSVVWTVECHNHEIEKVDIEFKKGDAATEFFPEQIAGSRHIKSVELTYKDEDPAYGAIVGTAPATQEEHKRKQCKYTVRGHTKGGPIELDPMILTTDK